ncbi:DUF3833 domain-containing protein [Paraglaciecola aquimarina]|uniref:DUF3833 domain-containing protein n=1 Tax=Paraglaciecola algarum TaxID=3050085 RepID=A0ABS9DDE4_9ALTE|nr:DUF3833 domain-containing protein [Paraglaciecola sp. G1-23]MCF2949794.1 DUF3833 domain-containing protein [Paraglaciecola sp. G1-23]
MNKCLKMVCIMLLVSSCTTDITSYRESQPKFDIKQYFDGNIIAWGMVQDYSDKVTRRFCVEIIGTWQGNEGTLAETFYFNDGEISYRNWQLSKQLDGSYQGTAEDVVGTAIGKHQGFAFQLEYELLLKLEDDTYQVQMDDWMYLLNEYQVMNKTSMSKFGVKVADITLFFDKNASKTSCNSTL